MEELGYAQLCVGVIFEGTVITSLNWSGEIVVGRALVVCFFFSSRRRHTRFDCDWSSDVCSSDLVTLRASSNMVRLGLRGPLPRAARKQGEQSAREEAGDDDNNGAIDDERQAGRSEERRVGKEGRSRGAPDH